MWFPDYVLLFPNYNRIRILNRLRSRKTKQFLLDRHHHFLNNGIYRTVRLRNSEIMTVSVKPWLERICSDVEKSIEQFSEFYALDRMSRALHQGLLTKF